MGTLGGGWLTLCVIVGVVAHINNAGFWKYFFISVLISPLGGFIILLCKTRMWEKDDTNKSSKADELAKFKRLLDIGAITADEYEDIKWELLNK